MKFNDYNEFSIRTIRLGPKSKRHARKPASSAVSVDHISFLQPELAATRRDLFYASAAKQSQRSKSSEPVQLAANTLLDDGAPAARPGDKEHLDADAAAANVTADEPLQRAVPVPCAAQHRTAAVGRCKLRGAYA